MTKLALKLVIGDKELLAIGHVAAQWAYLETELDYIGSILESHARDAGIEVSNPQSFMRRMQNIRKYAKAILKPHKEPLTELLSIVDDASSLRGFRDDIIHGHWKLQRTKKGLTTSIRVIKQRPSTKISETVFTAEKAEDIAAKISVVSLKTTTWHQKYVY